MSTDYMFNWNLPHPLYASVMTLVVIGAVVMVVGGGGAGDLDGGNGGGGGGTGTGGAQLNVYVTVELVATIS